MVFFDCARLGHRKSNRNVVRPVLRDAAALEAWARQAREAFHRHNNQSEELLVEHHGLQAAHQPPPDQKGLAALHLLAVKSLHGRAAVANEGSKLEPCATMAKNKWHK